MKKRNENSLYSIPLLLLCTLHQGVSASFYLIWKFYIHFVHMSQSGEYSLCYYWKWNTTAVIFIEKFQHSHPKLATVGATDVTISAHTVFSSPYPPCEFFLPLVSQNISTMCLLQNLEHDSSLAPVSSLDYKRWLCIFHFPFPRTWHNPSMKHLSDECFFEWKKNESHINCVYSNVTTWEPVIFRFSQISLYSIHLKKISLYNKHSDDISASAKKRI